MAEDVEPSRNAPHVEEPFTDRLKGGIIVTVVAILLVLATFYISSPTVPRVMAILVAVVGVAIIPGLVPVRAPQDFYGGLALTLLGIFAIIASTELPGQRGFAFGPGTAPRLFAIILAALGVTITLVGMFSDGPRIEKYKIRGPALVIVGISLFAALIRPFGLVVATYLAFIVSITGSKEMRWIEALIAAAAMTLGCVLLFVYQANAPQLLLNQFADLFGNVFLLLRKLIPGL
jgi:putative tricarboxylic transport membrane protein